MNFDPLRQISAASSGPAERQRAILRHFHMARQQAAMQEVLARLTGRSNRLLSFEEVTQQLRLAGRAHRGLQEIPLDAIIGSVGRYSDFTRTFLPRHDSDRERWSRIKSVFNSSERDQLPPIDVYKVGDVYFVLDGNHRVSVARQEGLTHIEARVVEVSTPVPLSPDLQPDDLIVKAEYANFLEQTGLGDFCARCHLAVTAAGRYSSLKEEIDASRYLLEQQQGGPVSIVDAALAWYNDVYQPTVVAIRERGLLRAFPGRTETDLYLWVAEHRQALEQELGWAIRDAQNALWQTLRIVSEPGGAAALAPLLTGQYRPSPGERVGVLLCGANSTAVNFDG